MRKIKWFFPIIAGILFLFVFGTSGICQETIVVMGKITNSNSGKPIPFANISVAGESIGLISNEFGEFKIKIPSSFKENDLLISAIGFTRFKQKISSFTENDFHIIKIEPKVYEIDEVRVEEKRKRGFRNPKKIVKLAIENLENNYPQVPYSLKGYYREYLKHGDKNYLNMLEGGVLIKDRGFTQAFFPYKAYLLQLRYNEDFEIIKDFELAYSDDYKEDHNQKYIPNHQLDPLGGNELSILFAHDAIRRHDQVSYSYIDQFNKNFIPNHLFKLDSIIYTENVPIYSISFKYFHNHTYIDNEHVKKFDIRGNILIRSNTYAIEKLQYTRYSLEEPKKKLYEVICNYKNHNDKMYLNYLSLSNYFNVSISSKSSNNLELPVNLIPLQMIGMSIKNNYIELTFNKELSNFSATHIRNYEIVGSVSGESRTDIANKHQITLDKNPKEVVLLRPNVVQLHVPNISYLLREEISENIRTRLDIKGNNYYLNAEGSVAIKNNTIKLGNVNLKLNGIKDVDGNKLNDHCTINVHQFRELFINEIPKSNKVPYYARVIFNEIPLYKQLPVEVESFWDQFNYPASKPLQDSE